MTDSNHLCFWRINTRKDRCFCAHHLNVTRHLNISSLNYVFMPSPGQIHIIKINDICKWNNMSISPNIAIDKRMGIDIKLNNNNYPYQNQNYLTMTQNEKENIWRKWMNKRKVKQIKKIKNGVVYFIENNLFFNILRCDENVINKYLNKNKDLNLFYKKCETMNFRVYEWCEENQCEYPDIFPGIQCKINTKFKIKHIYVYNNFIMIFDSKYYLNIYTDFGLFIRRIFISDHHDDKNKKIQFGFDGEKFWILINKKKLYLVAFNEPDFN